MFSVVCTVTSVASDTIPDRTPGLALASEAPRGPIDC